MSTERMISVAALTIPLLLGVVVLAAAEVCLRDPVSVPVAQDECKITYDVYDGYRCESGNYVYYVGSYQEHRCFMV